MGKDSSQFLTSLYLGSLSILSFSSCNAESITVFGTPINSPIKYNGVLFDLDSCAIFISKKKLCETNRPRVFYCPPTGITFFIPFFSKREKRECGNHIFYYGSRTTGRTWVWVSGQILPVYFFAEVILHGKPSYKGYSFGSIRIIQIH